MRIPLLLFGLIACLLCAPLVRAQQPDYDHFITEALQAYDAGRFAEARTLFRRAHDLQPTARTFRTLGMCSFNLGDYIDALQNLEAALADLRKPLTREQQAHVSELIERANRRVGRFRLKLAPENASLRVDAAVPVLLSRRELLLEPGRHVIELTAEGHRPSQRELTVEAGDRATLEFHLETATAEAAAAVAPAVAPPPSAPMSTPTPAPEAAATPAPAVIGTSAVPPARAETHGDSTRTVLGFVAVGLGAAGITTFAIAGSLALGKQSKLEEQCTQRQCGPDQYGAIDSYDRLRTVSTIGLISGAALLSVGAVLLFTGGEATHQSAAVTPEIGPAWAGVRGRL